MEQADAVYSGNAEDGVFRRLLDFLNQLDRVRIFYKLDHTRPDSVMVGISLPGWHWEVEFMADGSLDIERFRSVAGVENDPRLLGTLFADDNRLQRDG
jgi:hypothetical protein